MAPPAAVEQQPPVNRACESCRMLKVRCLPDETSSAGICQRCSKSGRNCVFAAPQKRRQRKRTDTRVAELEREVRSMRLLLEKNGTKSVAEDAEEDKASEESDDYDIDSRSADNNAQPCKKAELWADNEFNVDGASSTSQPLTPNDDGSSLTSYSSLPLVKDQSFSAKDVVDRGIVSAKVAEELFNCYKNLLVQHFPGVLLPSNSTAGEIRRSKPILFLAVICAACCNYDSELYNTLFDENSRLFADRIFIKGEKSLEIVQALTVTSLWYCPPNEISSYKSLRFYQYIHLAATMALDIGLGSQVDSSAMSLENSRTICACYLSCAGVAMRMRRPNMLRWTSWMSQCLDLLEKSPASTFLDKRLAAFVKLQIITDDYANFFSFEDPSTTVNLADTRMQMTLKSFERQLGDWKRNIPPDIMNEFLIMAYHQDSIYLYERIAIDGNFDDKENFNHKLFNPPQAISAIVPDRNVSGPLSATYVNAVISCIESMHALLDVFLSTGINDLRTSPILVFVRVSYSIAVLIKLYISTLKINVGSVLDRDALKVSHYLEACTEKLRIAAGSGKYRVPQKWLAILLEISVWYHKYDVFFTCKADKSTTETGAIQWSQSSSGKVPGGIAAGTVERSVGSQPFSLRPDINKFSNEQNLNWDKSSNNEVITSSTAATTAWTSLDGNSSASPLGTSSQMLGLDSFGMDFPPNEFSFLDQPSDLDRNATWMTESMVMGDMTVESSWDDWIAQYTSSQ